MFECVPVQNVRARFYVLFDHVILLRAWSSVRSKRVSTDVQFGTSSYKFAEVEKAETSAMGRVLKRKVKVLLARRLCQIGGCCWKTPECASSARAA